VGLEVGGGELTRARSARVPAAQLLERGVDARLLLTAQTILHLVRVRVRVRVRARARVKG
jgi:hypothetical protein